MVLEMSLSVTFKKMVLVLKSLGLGLSIGLKKVSIAVSKILVSEKKSQTQNKVLVSVPMNILTLHSANMYVLWLDQYSHKALFILNIRHWQYEGHLFNMWRPGHQSKY